MPTRFEDLLVWQKARELTRAVYRLTGNEPFRRDPALRDQIRRAAVSIMSNIAEGYERASDAELHRFLSIARGSCGELRSQLYVATDQRYAECAALATLSEDASELSRMLSGFAAAVRKQHQEHGRSR